MVRQRKEKTQHQLTDVELELMTLLWVSGGGTVRDVQHQAKRALAYTSVSTILRILEQKGVVSSRKVGQTHIYEPKLSRSDYEASALNRFVATVFANEPGALVARLLDGGTFSHDDLESLRAMVDERLARDEQSPARDPSLG